MLIHRLELTNFRNYPRAELSPCAGITALVGDNAQGKTNLLEAVYLCCTGRSHRTRQDRELILWGEEFCRVHVQAERFDGRHDVDIALPLSGRRRIKINGSEVTRSGELMGHVTGVLFSPEDLQLIKDSPAERRRFMDMALSQIRPAYYYALQRYQRALRQRNELLRAGALDSLEIWDEQLALCGAEVMRRRREYLESLSAFAIQTHRDISSDREALAVRYAPNITRGESPEDLLRDLFEARSADLKRLTTTVGPHRDDILLRVGGKELRAFGSQGQQRTAALSLRLAELRMVQDATGEAPILLLDDVMSELDPDRRRQLLLHLRGIQALITCTDLEDLAGAEVGQAQRVKGASLQPL